MATIFTLAERNFQAGTLTTTTSAIPAGTDRIKVTYSTADWPAVSDGNVTIVVRISDDGGNTWRDEWQDTFAHQKLTKTPDSQELELSLGQPFKSNSRLRLRIDSEVSIRTGVIVDVS